MLLCKCLYMKAESAHVAPRIRSNKSPENTGKSSTERLSTRPNALNGNIMEW